MTKGQRQISTGKVGVECCGTIEELAAAETINSSYVSGVTRITLLAPEIVKAILEGQQPPTVTLAAFVTARMAGAGVAFQV